MFQKRLFTLLLQSLTSAISFAGPHKIKRHWQLNSNVYSHFMPIESFSRLLAFTMTLTSLASIPLFIILCLIPQFGAPGGLCSSITESKHIKAVKVPWQMSNCYNALGQSTSQQTGGHKSQICFKRVVDTKCVQCVLSGFNLIHFPLRVQSCMHSQWWFGSNNWHKFDCISSLSWWFNSPEWWPNCCSCDGSTVNWSLCQGARYSYWTRWRCQQIQGPRTNRRWSRLSWQSPSKVTLYIHHFLF